MKMSETKLRQVVRSVIKENYEVVTLPAAIAGVHHGVNQGHHGDHSDYVQKAQKCISMAHDGSSRLVDMCLKICAASDRDLMAKCIELCLCACKCDIDKCCACLSEICSDPRCAQICAECCKC